jgi:hypothetical protein
LHIFGASLKIESLLVSIWLNLSAKAALKAIVPLLTWHGTSIAQAQDNSETNRQSDYPELIP